MNNKKALFKWIGGKKWLEPELEKIFSSILKKNKIKIYIEPFAGGLGSILSNLETLKSLGIEKILINDINSTLINTYLNLKNNPEDLYQNYIQIENNYINLIPDDALHLNPTKDKENLRKLLTPARDYYLNVRERFNEEKKENSKNLYCSALFLFIMNHCFNGVYRENKSGGFNVPYNWECRIIKDSERYETFKKYSRLFNDNNFEFYTGDAFAFIEENKKHSNISLFYLDPPYLNENMVENNYNEDSFGLDKQEMLLKKTKEMDHFVLSNHYLSLFTEFSEKNNLEYKAVYRSNMMNSKSESRGQKVGEILIYKK